MAIIKKPSTVYDTYANGVRDKNSIGSYKNTGVNGYQNAGTGGMSQTAMDAQKRNESLYAAQQASKPPLSFGGNVATPNVGSVTAPKTPMNNTDAAKAVYDMTSRTTQGANINGGNEMAGWSNESFLPESNPELKKKMMEIMSPMGAPVNTSTTLDTASQSQVSPTTQQNSTTMNMDAQIKSMQDAIEARYNDMMNQAKEVSRMNQSNIKGNIGRVFGANADTSEVAPATTENSRLNANLTSLGTAKNQALADLSMNALEKAQAQANIENQAKQAAQQQAFNNMVTQSQLTGMFNGGLTQDAQQNEFMRAIQEAGLTGQYKGGQTMSAQEQALSKAIQEAGLTGMYNGGLTQGAMQNIAGMTGYFNGQPTLGRDQMDLANQQKKMNDLMDYLSSIANNERNNETKYGVAGINNKSKEGIAAGNNESRETIASGNNASRETVAGMNNSSRESIASQNNASKFSLLEQKMASGTASGSDAKVYTEVARIQKDKDAARAASMTSDGFGGTTSKYAFDPAPYDAQIQNLLSLVEKKN